MKYPFLDLATANEPYLDELRRAACRVIDSGRYIGGPETELFERELADTLGAARAVGVGNGLDALRLILRAYMELGALQHGDEVIVPANSFVASALAVTDCGLVPVFADVDPLTHNLDWSRLPLTDRTRAVMPVHLYGRICEIPKNLPSDLIIVEDCAQAIGASIDGRHAATLGNAAAISFYPTKNVGALGDAGAVVTNDPDLARTVAMLRNYGTDRPYNNVYAGVNSRLDPIQAAMLRVKLPHLNEENDARRLNATTYISNITNPRIGLPALPPEPSAHVWHQFVITVDPSERDEFRRYMEENSVETAIHYPTPIHHQPCYSPAYGHTQLPVAEKLAQSVVSLPIGRGTSAADAEAIAQIINRYKNG